MMPLKGSILTFPGNVKYSSGKVGCTKYRSGSLVFEKDDAHGWKIKMMLDCNDGGPVLEYPLNRESIIRCVAKETVFIDVKKSGQGGDTITMYLKPANRSQGQQIKSLCDEIRKPAGTLSSAEVSLQNVKSTPLKLDSTNALAQNSHPNSTIKKEKENSPEMFTSVKTHKREAFDTEGKENLISSYSKPSDQFLQRSSEKSRQCLSTLHTSFYSKSAAKPQCTSTPNSWLSTKRGPGLMPDPTPHKKPRLSDGLSISYSMKGKPAQPENNQLQTLQGFSNLGNTCYMNAILQSLFGLETFSADLASCRRMLKTLQQNSLYYALVRLLHAKRQGNSSDVMRREALRRVKCAISTSAKRFSGYGQHDAHEFLGQVLDQLKEEVLKVSKSTPTPNKENEGGAESETDPASNYTGQNPITVNFEFEVLHTLTCLNLKCQEEVTKTEQFHDISLDVPKRKDLMTPRSLQDALSLFFKNETIDYTCEKCGHGKSEVSHKITKLPRVFILHLKRYTYNQMFSKHVKMGQNVSIPTFITMQNHCMEETQPPSDAVMLDQSFGEQKSLANVLTESKEDTPSRRKLDYGFKRTSSLSESPSIPADSAGQFTETKEKKDEVDCMTMEDETDPDISRAIAMSLKDIEEKDQIRRDYGEDSEANFERVLELSRHEHRAEQAPKKVHEMSEEEQIQLAIEQSLMETESYQHSNNTETEDVIRDSDHMYTRTDEVIGTDHDYPESFDIGPDGDNLNINKKATTNLKSYKRHRSKSESSATEDETKPDLPFEKYATMENHLKSGKMELQNNRQNHIKSEHTDPESNKVIFISDSEGDREVGDKNVTKKNWRQSLEGLSSKIVIDSDSDNMSSDLQCEEEMLPEDVESESEKTSVKTKCVGKIYEVGDIDALMEQESNHIRSNGAFLDVHEISKESNRANIKLEGIDSEIEGDSGFQRSDDRVKSKQMRPCQLFTTENKSTSVAETKYKDDLEFQSDDADDALLSQMPELDDKENTIPLKEKPTLSDPSDFADNTTESGLDEVDGFVDSNLNLPQINNEKGALPYSYRLVSIVNHMGISSATGHYLSDVFDMKKKAWYSCDDSHVTKISEADVRSKREKSGYIFFYMSKEIFDDLLKPASKKT